MTGPVARSRAEGEGKKRMGLMAGKQGLVMGVANDRSLAWGIAKALHGEGARLAFTYQGEALGKRVQPLAETLDSDFVIDADVTDERSLDSVFDSLAGRWGRLDFVVHAIAFSDKNELTGKYLDTTRANFLRTLDISCFSFTDVCRRAAPLMSSGGSLLTLTYAGPSGSCPLQRHGGRQGGARSQRALSRRRSRRRQYPGQRDLGRPDQHCRGPRHR